MEEFFFDTIDEYIELFLSEYGRAPTKEEIMDRFLDDLFSFFYDVEEPLTTW